MPFMRLPFPALLVVLCSVATAAEQRAYRLPDTDLKQRVIWGAHCELPDGLALEFGGEDQQADDGMSHTRFRLEERWQQIQKDLLAGNVLQIFYDRTWSLRTFHKNIAARARNVYFEGYSQSEEAQFVKTTLRPSLLRA